MAGDAKHRKVSGATAPSTAVAVDSFSPCWGEAEDVWTSLPVFLAAVNRWLLALVAADILTLAVGIAYVDILLRIADGGRQRAVWYQRRVNPIRCGRKKKTGQNVAITYHGLLTRQLARP